MRSASSPGFLGRLPVLLAAALLAACATRPDPDVSLSAADPAANPWARASVSETAVPSTGWKHQEFPGKRANRYRYVQVDGRPAMAVSASSSISMLRKVVHVAPENLSRVRFSWKVPQLVDDADLSDRDRADAPVRIVLAFEGDRSTFSPRDAMLSELAHALTGEPMPYATLMYVWDSRAAPGTVLTSKRTSRIRKLVMESGPQKLNQWLDYERDVRADFEKAFGEAPGALVSIGIMTDTDNTESSTTAWYGPVHHVRGR
jgi:Protein of unknown function (DUF3047)